MFELKLPPEMKDFSISRGCAEFVPVRKPLEMKDYSFPRG